MRPSLGSESVWGSVVESRTFRTLIDKTLEDLVEVRGVIEGARPLHNKSLIEETVRLKQKIHRYLRDLILEYIGDEEPSGLGARKKVSPWPKPGQSPSSIWADMQFLIEGYWELTGEHQDIDPAMSSEILTRGFIRDVSILSQKLRVARGAILERDPQFWTLAHESAWKAMDEHAREIISKGEGPVF